MWLCMMDLELKVHIRVEIDANVTTLGHYCRDIEDQSKNKVLG